MKLKLKSKLQYHTWTALKQKKKNSLNYFEDMYLAQDEILYHRQYHR